MKNVILWMVLTAIVGIGMNSCSNDDEMTRSDTESTENTEGRAENGENHILVPIAEVPEDVLTFFSSEIKEDGSNNVFFSSEEYKYTVDTCDVINDMESFEAIYDGKKGLPAIDFKKYTLIVGKVYMPEIPFIVTTQKIDPEKGLLTLNVTTPDAQLSAFYDMRYWGLYPKFTGRIIDVRAINEKGVNITGNHIL